MQVILTVTDGSNMGRSFTFAGRDFFVVGRGAGVHFQPDKQDLYFSRFHFLVEVNPPRCRLVDLGSRNGTYVNGEKTPGRELCNGDLIRAGHTVVSVNIETDSISMTDSWSPRGSITADHDGLPLWMDADPVVPGYRIVNELGRGGMGVVYLAESEADGSPVALKAITPGGEITRRNIELFLREASILKQLSHPNIVAFREIGSVDGFLYFTMEYVPGTDANRVVREQGPWSVRSAVKTMIEVLLALDYAHGQSFVHRDVKPANILLRRGDKGFAVKLADFGLARVYQASRLSGLSQEGEYGGTPAYMPPEQVTDYRNASPATDQFAAAASLYHLLTGKYIHNFQDNRPRVALVLEGEPVPIRARRPDLPAGLCEIIHQALSREPTARFATCADFAQALRPFAK